MAGGAGMQWHADDPQQLQRDLRHAHGGRRLPRLLDTRPHLLVPDAPLVIVSPAPARRRATRAQTVPAPEQAGVQQPVCAAAGVDGCERLLLPEQRAQRVKIGAGGRIVPPGQALHAPVLQCVGQPGVQLASDCVVLSKQHVSGLVSGHRAADPVLQRRERRHRPAAPDPRQQRVATPQVGHGWINSDLLRSHVDV